MSRPTPEVEVRCRSGCCSAERDEYLGTIGVRAVAVAPLESTVVSIDDAYTSGDLRAGEPEDLHGGAVELS